MGQQIARFRDQSRVSVEGGICFARRFRRRVMGIGDVGGCQPLRLTVDPIQRLIAGIR